MHSSIDYPKSIELSEQARHYVRALIKIHGILPFEYPQEQKKGEIDESLIIGTVDAKAVHKREAAKKRKARSKARKAAKAEAEGEQEVGGYNALLNTCDPQASPAELAQLAKQAKLALAEASRLAGEPVRYCCGAIRLESYKCGTGCSSKEHYIIVNKLMEKNNV